MASIARIAYSKHMAFEALPMASWVSDVEFEHQGPVRRALKAAVVNPIANYLPACCLKSVLRFGRSELAAANWQDPGGWRSMVISYDGHPKQVADRILVGAGTMAMALRNRKHLAARLIAGLIDTVGEEPVEVLCLGAGPGQIITEAMCLAKRDCRATLVDISSDPFEYGRNLAARRGLGDSVRFVQADVREIRQTLDRSPHVAKMLGICEYLTDDQIHRMATAVAEVMSPGGAVVFNSLSRAHGTDRFFRRVFGLHMNHRSPEHLQRLMEEAGFGDFATSAEPLGVYHVIVGRKGPCRTGVAESKDDPECLICPCRGARTN